MDGWFDARARQRLGHLGDADAGGALSRRCRATSGAGTSSSSAPPAITSARRTPPTCATARRSAGEDGADDQLRARRGGADAELGHHACARPTAWPRALVGERQPAAGRHRARRLPDIRRQHRRRHGSGGVGRDGPDRTDWRRRSSSFTRRRSSTPITTFRRSCRRWAWRRSAGRIAKIIDEANKSELQALKPVANASARR